MEKSQEEPASTPTPQGQQGDWLGEDRGCQAARPGRGAEVCTGVGPGGRVALCRPLLFSIS